MYKVTVINSKTIAGWCSVKKVFLKVSKNSLENTCIRVSRQARNFIKKETGKGDLLWILQNFQDSRQACNFIKKENVAKVFFREFRRVFKNSFFYRTPTMVASVNCYYV